MSRGFVLKIKWVVAVFFLLVITREIYSLLTCSNSHEVINDQSNYYNRSSNNRRILASSSFSSRTTATTTSAPVVLHWLFLTYHKTGTIFSDQLSQRFFERCNARLFAPEHRAKGPGGGLLLHNWPTKRRPSLLITLPDIIKVVPDFWCCAFNWMQAFTIPGHEFRIIHMLRDPIDVIISGYLYHSQVPVPHLEEWIDAPNFSIILHNPKWLDRASSLMGAYHGDPVIVQQWFNTSVNECQRLQASFPSGLTYGQMLSRATNKSNDIYPGLRLEACHSLFSMQYYGHDLTNMAANTLLQTSQANHNFIRAFRVVDLSPPNMTRVKETATRMFSFLYNTSSNSRAGRQCRLCNCTSVEQAVKMTLALQEGMHRPSNSSNSSNSSMTTATGNKKKKIAATNATLENKKWENHITQQKLSSKQREAFKQRLSADPDFGPLLNFYARIINRSELYG